MSDKKAKAGGKKKRQAAIRKMVVTVDDSFNESFLWIKLKHYLVDIIFTVLVIVIAAAVILILWLIQPAIALDPANSVAITLSVVAVFLSFIQLLMKWMSVPGLNYDAYMEAVVEKNCQLISEKSKVKNDLLLYAIVTMKSERPSVNLQEVMDYAPELFTESNLIARLYVTEPRTS